jgi:hypothetical protein
MNESRSMHNVEGLSKFVVGFTREANDDVGRDSRAVKGCMNLIEHAKKIIPGILAIHSAQKEIGAALQGKMKMGNDLGMGAENGEEFGVHVAGLETGEPKPAKAGNAGAK